MVKPYNLGYTQVMGTLTILFPRVRARIFRELFADTGREIHLRQLARQCGLAVGTIQDEITQLEKAGLLRSRVSGNRRYFRAHEGHPLFPEIHLLVLKTRRPQSSVKKPRTKNPCSLSDSTMVRPAERKDRPAWLRMRRGLWPGHTGHAKETTAYFSYAQSRSDAVVLVAELPDGTLAGFLELGLRDYAEGCLTSPAAYVEGWWVEAKHRKKGIGKALIRGAEAWARRHGLSELASDCELANITSAKAHKTCGFTETDRIICFRKAV
jgi:aminoglycoside 6'-N-acetyltransferase I